MRKIRAESQVNNNGSYGRFASLICGFPFFPPLPPLLVFIGSLIICICVIRFFMEDSYRIRKVAKVIVASLGAMCAMAIFFFDTEIVKQAQAVFVIPLLPQYSINLAFGWNHFSLCLIALSTIIMYLCIYNAEGIKNEKQYIIYLLLIELAFILCLLSTNILFFYVFFEAVLVPMYLIIGQWGSSERRVRAAFLIFLFTLIGSFFFLYGIIYLYTKTHTLDLYALWNDPNILSKQDQIYLWWLFCMPFAMKTPIFPLHLWLTEAHVEAPTTASVLLASLLLKLGGYGFLMIVLRLLPWGHVHYEWTLPLLVLPSIIIASIIAVIQSDLKRLIAYSSISHMGLVTIAIFARNPEGLNGAMYLMLAHGIVSAGLFFCVGVLYDRYGTRTIRNYSGLAGPMPIFCVFFLIFTCGNMAFPFTPNFIGEILVFVGVFDWSHFAVFLASMSVFIAPLYTMWTYNRMATGTLKIEAENIKEYTDVNRKEFITLLVLVILMVLFGSYSSAISDFIDPLCQHIIEEGNGKCWDWE